MSQVNKESFTNDIAQATGKIPDVRIKKKNSFEGKIERYRIKGKDPNTITDNLAQALKDQQAQHLREVKFLPPEYFFESSMFIFQDKIALISSEKELIGIMIQSADLAKMERQKFRLIWD